MCNKKEVLTVLLSVFDGAMIWMFVPTPNLYAEILSPTWLVGPLEGLED